MKYQIVSTTDDKNLGFVFENQFPVEFPNGASFMPDGEMKIGASIIRFYNSNYSIDAQEYKQ